MSTKAFHFQQAPGHLIRRAQQLAVAIFVEETQGFDITPVQFAILSALLETPGVDQVTLAARVAFDAATSGSVIGRLEAKGLLRRQADEDDRRRKLLWATAQGERMVRQMRRHVIRAQERILAPLGADERVQFMQLLAALVSGHEGPVT